MKTKRIYSTLAAVLLAMCLKMWAVEVSVTAGGLSGAVTDKTITDLRVKGEIDVRDLSFIAEELPSLKTLDLSSASVKAYSEGEAYFAGQTKFEANALPEYCFLGKKYETVVLPSALECIGTGAFAGCRALKQVVFPAALSEIGDYSFNSCDALVDVVIPASVKEIGTGAFSRCAGLKSADMRALTAECVFEADIFSNCAALEKAVLSENMSSVPAGMFACCHSLSAVELKGNASLESIGEEAFVSTALTSFDFASFTGLKVIGRWAFAGVRFEEVVLPESVRSVGEGAFFYNDALKGITLNENLTEISDFVLAGCSELTGNVKVSYNVNTIGRYAFSDTNMTSIYIGSLKYAGDRAFENNTALGEISIEAKEAPELGEDVFYGMDQPNVRLNVVAEGVSSYKAAEQWKEFNIVGDLSTLENVITSCDIKAYFTGKVLNVVSSETIEMVNVHEPGGVLLIASRPDAMSAAIDMSQMSGNLYIVTIKSSNQLKTVKLLRK